MKDLSLHILDIVRNSVEANATEISVSMSVSANNILTITFDDNGRGMSPEMVKSVTDPFVTTRTTRKVGLGLPLLSMNSELTGGSLSIESELGKGTKVRAIFNLQHIDCMPFGNLGSVFSQLLGGNPNIRFIFAFSRENDEFDITSDEVWAIMRETNTSQLKLMIMIKEMINENLKEIGIINS
jgi:anti-sigma regulatory factor (Ser/Thr protein kinase)